MIPRSRVIAAKAMRKNFQHLSIRIPLVSDPSRTKTRISHRVATALTMCLVVILLVVGRFGMAYLIWTTPQVMRASMLEKPRNLLRK